MDQPTTPATAASTGVPATASPKKKRRGLRILGWLVLVLVVIAGVAIGIVLAYINPIVERQFETGVTTSTNLKTELSSANLSLFGGELTLKGLEVGSPKGFAAPHMMTLDGVGVKVSYGQLRKEPIHIQSVRLDDPKLVVERSDAGFNFKVATDLMPPTDPNSEIIKLIIDDLTITNTTVVIRPNLPVLPPEVTVAVPTINMKNIGSGEGAQNGAAVKEVLMQVITVIAARATESDKLPDQLKNLMMLDVSQAMAQLGSEAQKRIAEAVPGELGQMLGKVAADPQAFLKDPGAALEGALKGADLGELLDSVGKKQGAEGEPADDADALIQEGLKGLLGEKKEKEKKDRKRE